MEIKDICRLCLETIDKSDYESDVSKNVQDLIEHYFGIKLCTQVSVPCSNIIIPMKVCPDCQYKILGFHKFKEKVSQSQEQILLMTIEELEDQSMATTDMINSTVNEVVVEYVLLNQSNFVVNTELENITYLTPSPVAETSITNQIENKVSFECDTCNRKFHHKNVLKLHMDRFHVNTALLICDHCTKTFENEHALQRHAMYCHPDDPKKYCRQCQFCDKILKNHIHLKNHIQKRHPSKNIKAMTCSTCEKGFKNIESYKKHQKEFHDPLKDNYICQFCSNSFSRKSQLLEHEAIHGDVKVYKCEWCTTEFRHSSHLSKHRMMKHSKDYIKWKRKN